MKSRLRKNTASEVTPENSVVPYGLIFKDIDQKIVDKDKITDITYGPSISREWLFEQPIDNPEWALQSKK